MSSKTKKIIAILSSVTILLAIILAVAIPTKTDKAVDVICTNLDQFYVPDTFKVRRCIYITKGDVLANIKNNAGANCEVCQKRILIINDMITKE